MSKTVKRVMTVMMIGLIAMLGVKAEAHARWVNGKLRICSIEAKARAKVPDQWKLPGHFALAELTATVKDVAIRCAKGQPEPLRGKRATLIGESLDGVETSKWYDHVDDEGNVILTFDIHPVEHFKTLGFCAGGEILDAQVNGMNVEYKLSDCVDNDPSVDPSVCSNRVLLNTMKYNDCKPDFDKPEPDGKCFPYKCLEKPDSPVIEEAHPGPLAK